MKQARNKIRQMISGVLATALAINGLASLQKLPSSATEVQYLVLGDDISTGSGLAEGTNTYVDYLEDCLGSDITNRAADGLTTVSLLEGLEAGEYTADIQAADVILITIGSNDAAIPTETYFTSLMEEGDTLMDLFHRYAGDTAAQEQFITDLNTILSPATSTAKANIPLIEAKLLELNPDAEIQFQTLYNPIEFRSTVYNGVDYSTQIKSFYDFFASQLSKVNKQLYRNLTSATYADVAAAFSGTAWIYTNFGADATFDVRPSALGQAVIAATVLDALNADGSLELADCAAFYEVVANLDENDAADLPEEMRQKLLQYAGEFATATTTTTTTTATTTTSSEPIYTISTELVLRIADVTLDCAVTEEGLLAVSVAIPSDLAVAGLNLQFQADGLTAVGMEWLGLSGAPVWNPEDLTLIWASNSGEQETLSGDVLMTLLLQAETSGEYDVLLYSGEAVDAEGESTALVSELLTLQLTVPDTTEATDPSQDTEPSEDTGSTGETDSTEPSEDTGSTDETEPTEPTEALEILLGDVNADGTIDSDDAVLVLKAYTEIMLNGTSSLTDLQMKAADITENDTIDSDDAVQILKLYVQSMLS